MPLPRLLARINKHTFNRFELKRNNYSVLTHTGRNSGVVHRTPLEVHPVDGGYVIFLMYGSGSDWVRNVVAAGGASLRHNGEDVELVAPNIIDERSVRQILPADVKLPPGFFGVDEFLRMDTATG